jgi:predicted  nucleic acid-binding Zn-ribbon protein
MGMDVALMRKRVNGLFGLLSAISGAQGVQKGKVGAARATKQLRDLESRVSILKDALEEIDVKMEEMMEESTKKRTKMCVNFSRML